jgi:predicted ATPase/DNA-binding winged helix-turn-helix (wHTH) protein
MDIELSRGSALDSIGPEGSDEDHRLTDPGAVIQTGSIQRDATWRKARDQAFGRPSLVAGGAPESYETLREVLRSVLDELRRITLQARARPQDQGAGYGGSPTWRIEDVRVEANEAARPGRCTLKPGLRRLPSGRCPVAAESVISFGPYSLIPASRLLLRDGEPIEVGSRALDVLIALAEAAGDVIDRRELLDRAWPNVVVTDACLRVTIANLRKDLGDGLNGARYIANVTGRGYCFVAPVTRSLAEPLEAAPLACPSAPPRAADHRLPARLARMVGRDDTVEVLSMLLASRRFVSVVGPGGMGKTTVAISVGHTLLDAFDDAVYFVDLGAVTDPALVPGAAAAALGVISQTQDALPDLLAVLADRRVLLILDNCEHVINAAVLLTERLYSEAPQVHILTTSREALRAEGEQVHLLAPLDYPTPGEQLTAAQALATSAVQLFMDRAFAAGYTAKLTDADAPVVAGICSRLDGIAFVIELAASRVAVYGLQGTADLLSNRFKLLWQGRRSAPPRQQTLTAMLDWSFNLLSDRDRRVLGRLSTFVGVFTLEAAQAAACDDHIDAMEAADAIASLIDKSLILVVPIDGILYHRLLDPTLAYAAEKFRRSVDASAMARNH